MARLESPYEQPPIRSTSPPAVSVSVITEPRLRGGDAVSSAGGASPDVLLPRWEREDAAPAARDDSRRPAVSCSALVRLARRLRLSVLSYSICQIVMITVNKALTSVFDFKSVAFLLLAQNLGLGCFLIVLIVFGFVRVSVPLRTYLLSMPQCLFYVCYLSTGLYALDHLSVPVYTLMKNTCPVLIAVTESVVRNSQHTPPVVISLFTILVGVSIGQDATGSRSWASAVGVLWMLLHMYFNVCYVVYTREFMARCAPTRLQSMLFTFMTSLPLYVMLVTFFNEWESAHDQIRALVHTHGVVFVGTFAASVVVGVFLTFSIFWVCQQSSALTLSVIGSFNKVPIVITAMVVFGAALSLRNAVGLVLVFAGSIGYAHSLHKFPPTPLTSWSRTNAAMLGAVTLFLGITVSQVLQAAPPQLQGCWQHAGKDAQPRHPRQPPQSAPAAAGSPATLAVLFPGAAAVSVVDFVTRYLPALATAVRLGLKTQGKTRRAAMGLKGPGLSLPRRDDPLRLGWTAPVLVLNSSSSPLLHPNLLPFLGSTFAEVLVEEDPPGEGLLRVVRWPQARALLGGLADPSSNDTFVGWGVLALARAALPPPPPTGPSAGSQAAVPRLYVAIDASTAVCTAPPPKAVGSLAAGLCPQPRRAGSALPGGELLARRTAGLAAVGDFASAASTGRGPIGDAAVLVWRRGRWQRALQPRPRGQGLPPQPSHTPAQSLGWRHRCAARLSGPSRGLLPSTGDALRPARRDSAANSTQRQSVLPGLVRLWHKEHPDLGAASLPAAQCPSGTAIEDPEADMLGAGGHAGALLHKARRVQRDALGDAPHAQGDRNRASDLCPDLPPGQERDDTETGNLVLFGAIASLSLAAFAVVRCCLLARVAARK
eukprot:TRINITY_DN32907_c0_g1_i1.p1 TRINITY_DN32907_c0_g1~~TRINITY_DN32907_c0_g1_i1.p1  ORF type:complete len:917 (+),score=256.85 TRINITY_DN32907_c0_g1_i1:111-2753(+)